MPHAVRKNHVAGREITKHLTNLLHADNIMSDGGISSW